MRVLSRILGLCALAMLIPSMASAQASIAGVVRDVSGAVVPGVTVETSGVQINMIPREGGNTLRGSFYGTFGNDAMQGSNYDDRLRSLGRRAPNEVLKVWEVAGQAGGPVVRDRLWVS